MEASGSDNTDSLGDEAFRKVLVKFVASAPTSWRKPYR